MRALGEACQFPREKPNEQLLEANHKRGNVWFFTEKVGEFSADKQFVVHTELIKEMAQTHNLAIDGDAVELRYWELLK